MELALADKLGSDDHDGTITRRDRQDRRDKAAYPPGVATPSISEIAQWRSLAPRAPHMCGGRACETNDGRASAVDAPADSVLRSVMGGMQREGAADVLIAHSRRCGTLELPMHLERMGCRPCLRRAATSADGRCEDV